MRSRGPFDVGLNRLARVVEPAISAPGFHVKAGEVDVDDHAGNLHMGLSVVRVGQTAVKGPLLNTTGYHEQVATRCRREWFSGEPVSMSRCVGITAVNPGTDAGSEGA